MIIFTFLLMVKERKEDLSFGAQGPVEVCFLLTLFDVQYHSFPANSQNWLKQEEVTAKVTGTLEAVLTWSIIYHPNDK